ncbi:isoleucine--tRNA ligase [Candidatus Poribacteria bacterium]|nr:isoleucine--tRNA ligase [Candidatus Poribacteria bacterium]
MFKEVSTDLNFPQREIKTIDFWNNNDIFQKTISNREGCPDFVFYEGPPTANGMPTIAHTITRTMKDLICRYKTMTGHYVGRKAGWDTHGLPVELEVEKELGISGKRQIEDYGVEKFNQKCKDSVFKYVNEWNDLTQRIGYWLDLDHPYITLTNDYIESVWWALKRFWEEDMLYQAYKVVPYCARCGTPLSSHEVAQGYTAVKDPSVFVKMRLVDEENTSLLVWTTTPWTLPSNVAVAVGEDYDYVMVEWNGEKLILAEELLNEVFDTSPEVIQKMKGLELVGETYKPLFDFVKPEKKAYYAVAGDFVTLKEGTGIVHMAPAFGQDDYEMSRKHDLPVIQPVDLDGRFTEVVEPWAEKFVKDADPGIIENLKERGLLFKEEIYTHDYPFCWRCDSPLLYYARSSWFIKTTTYKNKMIEQNRKINWYPEHIKEGIFGNWLENNVDWAISRDRYWGTPLNIWICQECNQQHSVGSIAELRKLSPDVPEDIELHKPYIDDAVFPCEACGGDMLRVPEVIDCWFDAGMMHTAQWHYPHENEYKFKHSFPGDYICEAIDQTRGWFYSLLATSVFLYGETSYKNCLVVEHVLGPDGKKMSKSKGNRINPEEILDVHGADALRWYFCSSPPWTRRPLSKEAVEEVIKKFMGTLHNVYSFFVLYANIDQINPLDYNMPFGKRSVIDKWILSLYNNLVKTVRENMDEYNVSRSTRAINDFVDDLSNWYVRRSRDRYWGSEMDDDKIAAYKTLYEVLVGVAKLVSPFMPFMAEEIYQNLVRSIDPNAPESIHLCDYPVSNAEAIDSKLEEDMAYIRELVILARAARNRVAIKTRQPLAEMIVSARTDAQKDAVERFKDLIVDEINVKSVDFAKDVSELVDYNIKPVFSMIGRKYGKLVPKIASKLSEIDGSKAKSDLENNDVLKLEVEDQIIELLSEEVEISVQDREGYVTETEDDLFASLLTELTPELIQEGFAREIINKIQFMRKEADFNVTDRIRLYIKSTDAIYDTMENFMDYIMSETLTKKMLEEPTESTYVKEWNINGEKATIGVEQING